MGICLLIIKINIMKGEINKNDILQLITGSSLSMFFIDLLKNLFVTSITMIVTVTIGYFLQRYLKDKYDKNNHS